MGLIQLITFLAPIVSSFLFLMFLVKLFLRRSSRNPNVKAPKLPPGPWKLPIIGSLHHLAGSKLPHRTLRALSNKYGPLMHLQLGEISTIIVSSPEMAEEVLKVHDLAFLQRPQLVDSNVTGYAGKDIIFSPYGAYWRQMRKICHMELLAPKNVRRFSSIRAEEVKEVMESIKKSAKLPINMTDTILSFANSVTARAAFGKRCKDQEAVIEVVTEVAKLIAGFSLSEFFPSVKLLHSLSSSKAKLVSLHRKMDDIMQRIVSEHEENMERSWRGNGESGEEDLVDVLLRHQNSNDLEVPITTDGVKAVIMDMISAGTDTASVTIAWAMSELMKNPETMKKAQTEVRKAWIGRKNINHEADVQGLKYLNLVIKETLRLHMPAPLLAPRECRIECEINGYTIPVKTRLLVNSWAIGRDPRHWHDAESFLPERFNDDSSINFGGTDLKYIPFGAGRRMCPGSSFGVSTVEILLAHLLYNFDWELPDGMKPEDLDMSEVFGVTTPRRKDLYLVATPYVPVNFIS